MTADGFRSPGVGISLPGSWTAAAPWATAAARASGPSPPAARKPAREASPAPTLERTAATGAEPYQTPSPVTRSWPSAPRLARTAPAPRSRSSSAAFTASPTVASGRPTASASSSAFGLTTSGRAARAASRDGPEVSSAIRAPAPCARVTSRAYHSGARPRGRLPQQAIQSAAGEYAPTVVRIVSDSSSVSSGPGALIFVSVPSGSASAMFERVCPATGTGATSMPRPARSWATRAPGAPPSGTTATVRCPAAATARETLTPLPPGSTRSAAARSTSPRSRAGTSYVRSREGLGVTVRIMRGRLPFRPPRWRRRPRR